MSLKVWTGVAMSVLWVSAVGAQDRPSFTGTWVQEATDTSQRGPTVLKIKDEPALLTIETSKDGMLETLTFSWLGETEAVTLFGAKDDSKDRDVNVADANGPSRVQQTRVRWQGDHLETYMVRLINGRTVTQTMRYVLGSNGTRLKVQRDLQVQHGYTTTSGAAGWKSAAAGSEEELYVKQ